MWKKSPPAAGLLLAERRSAVARSDSCDGVRGPRSVEYSWLGGARAWSLEVARCPRRSDGVKGCDLERRGALPGRKDTPVRTDAASAISAFVVRPNKSPNSMWRSIFRASASRSTECHSSAVYKCCSAGGGLAIGAFYGLSDFSLAWLPQLVSDAISAPTKRARALELCKTNRGTVARAVDSVIRKLG